MTKRVIATGRRWRRHAAEGFSRAPRAWPLLLVAVSLLPTDLAPPNPVHHVRVENPKGLPLVLMKRQDGDFTLEAELGRNLVIERDLTAGTYRVDSRGAGDGRSWALPLPRQGECPPTVTLVIEPPPPPVDGWVWVPPGPAVRGDLLGVGQEDERPARVTHVPGFWMMAKEVTTQEFADFLNAHPSPDPRWVNLESRKSGLSRRDGVWSAHDPEFPAVCVSWFGAVAYADWKSAVTGERHRLPTETEWEKAARGPDTLTYSYGNVYTTAAANQESGRLRPVGSFLPTGYGFHDLTGNAFEWCADVYQRHDDITAAEGRSDPANPLAPRSLRGGSFVLDGMYLRNSFRMFQRPSVQADDFGFRLVREMKGDAR